MNRLRGDAVAHVLRERRQLRYAARTMPTIRVNTVRQEVDEGVDENGCEDCVGDDQRR